MLDKWKARQELCKAHNMYRKKVTSFLYSASYTYDEYEQLKEIEYAIAYVLCEYFDFNYEFYYEFPFSYKWYIAYDYIHFYNECKKAYENIIQENNKCKRTHESIIKENNNINCDYIAQNVKDLSLFKFKKGDVIYTIDNGCLYLYDGKNFHNMC